jgi:hypothetical protein
MNNSLPLSRATSLSLCFLTAGLFAMETPLASGAIFTDSTGDATLNNAGGTADIVQMEVTDNASDVIFTLRVNGNIATTGWANFMIGIATLKSAGSTNSNAWNRPILMNVVNEGVTNGMTHWIGSWVNSGGGSQFWTHGPSGWSGPAGLAGYSFSAAAQSTLTYTVSKASLGVTTGDVIYFDAYSSGSGSGDGALDALANPATSITDWGQTYTSSSTNSTVRSYTLGFDDADSDEDGLPDSWEMQYFGDLDEDGNGDGDTDSLSNANELVAGTDPTNGDSDSDGLSDGIEVNTQGTNPTNPNTDGDGANDGAEVAAGTNPLKFNHTTITVAGSFQGPGDWQPGPFPADNPLNVMSPVSGDEFGWELLYNFGETASYLGRFAVGSWSLSWGQSQTPGFAESGVPFDIPFDVSSAGIWRFYFNTDTLAYAFERATFADYATFAAAYGIDDPDGQNDDDGDGLTNQQEFEANTSPFSADTDGDAVSDAEELDGSLAAAYFGVAIPTNPANADTDGDGMADGWEIAYYLDPTDDGTTNPYTTYIPGDFGLTITENPNGGTADPDQDGLTNLQEFAAGSDPLVPGDQLVSNNPLITLPASFNGFNAAGTAGNTMQLTANFTWKLLLSFTEVPENPRFKFATGSFATNWGPSDTPGIAAPQAPGDISAADVITAAGLYMITFNDFDLSYSVAPLDMADTDSDGLPDEWEAYYGSFLEPRLSDLDPDTDYTGDGISTLQAYLSGAHPTLDVIAPTVNLAPGVDSLTWVANGASITQPSTDDIVATDDVTNPPLKLIQGITIDTSVDGIYTVNYGARDAAGNESVIARVIIVGDAPPTYYSLHFPAALGITTAGTGSVYGQIYLANATPGDSQAPAIQAWIGLNNENTDPSTWDESSWLPASYNAGQTGNNDEYGVVVDGNTLVPGTYYYAARWQIGSGAFFYGGITAEGNGDAWGTRDVGTPPVSTTYGNGVLTVTQAVFRDVTFSVDMNVQAFKQNFDPAVHGVEVRGSFNGFGGGQNVLTDVDGDGIYSGTFPVEGAEGSEIAYKFYATGDGGLGYEAGADRVATLPPADNALDTGTNFFSNLAESRQVTLQVDMAVQQTLGNFNSSSDTVFAAGTFNGWSTTATQMSATGNGLVYAVTVYIDGPVTSAEYKFNIGGIDTGYESVTNRTISPAEVGSSLSLSVLPAVFFNNDQGGSSFESWYGGATEKTNELLVKYAIGAASGPGANDGVDPIVSRTESELSITVIVRTDDPDLTVTGQSLTDLTSGTWDATDVTTTVEPDQTGVLPGFELRTYSVPSSGDSKRFLRLLIQD